MANNPAEPPPASKPASGPHGPASAAAKDPSNVFSLEDLDKIIETEDPNFKKGLEDIAAQKVDPAVSIETINVDTDDHAMPDEEETDESWRARLIKRIKSPFLHGREKLKLRMISFKNRLIYLKDNSKQFIRHDLPDLLRFLKSRVLAYFARAREEVRKFIALSRAQKIAIFFISAASLSALFLVTKMFSPGWLPHYEDPLIHSMDDGSRFVGAYQDKKDLQDFFQAFPEIEYYVLMTKAIVNLAHSDGATPAMGAFEVYLGLDSQDTAIEVKDREKEILDIMQRALENFSYDEASSQIGKTRMKSVIRDRINDVLNQGKVFHVYFNTFIISH